MKSCLSSTPKWLPTKPYAKSNSKKNYPSAQQAKFSSDCSKKNPKLFFFLPKPKHCFFSHPSKKQNNKEGTQKKFEDKVVVGSCCFSQNFWIKGDTPNN